MNREFALAAAVPMVTGLAAVWLAFEAANLTWSIVDGDASSQQQTGNTVVLIQQQADRPRSLLSDITQYHLFGKAEGLVSAPIVREVVNAPKTKLNLTLRGLFSSENGAFALISSGRGEEQVYKVGMKINSSTEIDAIHDDSVVLKRAGRLEVLYLDESASSAVGERNRQGMRGNVSESIGLANRNSGSAGDAKFGKQREQLLKNPQQAMSLVRAQPVMVQGKMTGYRVNPGSDPQLFRELGFRPGDLIQEVNGIAVNNPAKIGNLMNELTSAKQLNVTILRSGRSQNLLIEF
ncbi:MAG: type II secretion system protein GspC [Gammaproteobacteria bacterium]|nr:type II secretion system protein GspC [Gammaproteobacteria bacterium]